MRLTSLLKKHEPCVLALADGTIFKGVSVGVAGEAIGEVVFNTSMTGYQEVLTDPSYADQIITFTYPHIGNTGINIEDFESTRVWAKGLVIRELSPVTSNWRSQKTLQDFLKEHNVVAIAEVDTRKLTRILREAGAQPACIMTGNVDPEIAIAKARSFPSFKNRNLSEVVTLAQTSEWKTKSFQFVHPTAPASKSPASKSFRVVVYDFGVKNQICRFLADRHCEVIVVPENTSVSQVLALNPDGILLSNGPGDPEACTQAIQNIQALVEKEIPIFGICLGFQLLALALGAKTFKMKRGHHGSNHPVLDEKTQRVFITAQNHGFAVEEKSLPSDLLITHRSLFDNTLQGIAHRTKPAFAFQGHPEANPGPQEMEYLFDQFMQLMEEHIAKARSETVEL
jgi:carbamoyl-phosphate synthase small subunit